MLRLQVLLRFATIDRVAAPFGGWLRSVLKVHKKLCKVYRDDTGSRERYRAGCFKHTHAFAGMQRKIFSRDCHEEQISRRHVF